MLIVGYFAALLIGVSLGLIGGGGSILTVPVLVYLFGVDAVAATTYSLFVVGLTSAVGAAQNYRRGSVQVRTALLFGLPAAVVIVAVKQWLVPLLPLVVWQGHLAGLGWVVHKGSFLLLLFAGLMLASASGMIRNATKAALPNTAVTTNTNLRTNTIRLVWQGCIVGFVTGLLGAGGGFLIIPALVLYLRLDMRTAVGTSLLIIALNSAIGFASGIGILHPSTADIWLLVSVAIPAVAGIFIGTALARRLSNAALRRAFGVLVLTMGAYILIKEILASAV